MCPAARLATDVSLHPWAAPEHVRRAVMLQWWQDLTFLHWPLEREHLQQLLPGNLDVDTFDGAAWIGLVAFRLTVRAPGVPKVPWASAFPEINLRTYVRGPDGRAGI